MVNCSIKKCKSRSVKGGTLKFFRFPTKESVAEEWLRHCGPKTKINYGRVCSNHFLASDYIKPLQLLDEALKRGRNLKPDAIPSLHIYNTDIPEKTCRIENSYKDKPEALRALETEDTEPYPLPLRKETNNISIVAIDIPSKTVCSSSDIKCFPGECNTTPAIKTEESTDVESVGIIKIPLEEHEQLQRTAKKFNILKQNLEKIFSSSQIRCLMKPDMRRVRWSDEDIAAAVSLRRISPKAYRHMRVNVGIPLPGFSTVRNWVAKFGRGKYETFDAEHNNRLTAKNKTNVDPSEKEL